RPEAAVVQGRITADAVIGAADALPVERILASITPIEEELLRLIMLVPDQLPSTPARELFRAIVLQRAANDQGIHPPFSMSALMGGLDDETRGLAQAILARPSPDLARVGAERIAY